MDGSLFSELAGPPLCTGIISAMFQSAVDTVPFTTRAGTIREAAEAYKAMSSSVMLPAHEASSALFSYSN